MITVQVKTHVLDIASPVVGSVGPAIVEGKIRGDLPPHSTSDPREYYLHDYSKKRDDGPSYEVT